MYLLIYDTTIQVFILLLKLISPFHSKAKLMLKGRQGLWKKIKNSTILKEKVIWFHVSSLGEFEQARPIIEKIKQQFSTHKIVLTFFSPSGYEKQKKYQHADYIYYMPFDTRKNAKKFIQLTNPQSAIFVKYDFWYHFLNQLKKQKINLYLISACFRENQVFFKNYGKKLRNILHMFDVIFVQNQSSKKLLQTINIRNIKIAGDTRCDRVLEIKKEKIKFKAIKQFKQDKRVFILGSCWKEDMQKILAPLINNYSNSIKFIIAPHNISNKNIRKLKNYLTVNSTRLSLAGKVNISHYNVLFIDNIGMLSKLYKYADFAYIGGAFGEGLHNILEPAVFGMPIFFGKSQKSKKFVEATELLLQHGAFEVSSFKQLEEKFIYLQNNNVQYTKVSNITKEYIKNKAGATDKILSYIASNLLKTKQT